MPSRASKRVKRSTKSEAPEQNKSKDNHQDEHSSVSSFDGEVKPIEGGEFHTPSIAPSTPSTEYTKATGSSKKRKQNHLDDDSDYETLRILKGDAHVRDPTEIPLIATNSDGDRKILWAKMDTGAAINIIAEKLVQRLGLTDQIEPLTSSDVLDLGEIGGNHLLIDRKIKLSFNAGRKHVLCKDVEFWIPRQDDVDSDLDGVPDVLLCLKTLVKYHMIMVDPDFCLHEPEEGLEVLAKRAWEEAEKPAICCLPIKYGQVRTR